MDDFRDDKALMFCFELELLPSGSLMLTFSWLFSLFFFSFLILPTLSPAITMVLPFSTNNHALWVLSKVGIQDGVSINSKQ